jgi:hypothetical protein
MKTKPEVGCLSYDGRNKRDGKHKEVSTEEQTVGKKKVLQRTCYECGERWYTPING